jgi:hypothetical protein
MSSFTNPDHLPPFSPAATQAAVEASTETYPSDYIINILLDISSYLVTLAEDSKLFGRPNNDQYSPSLRTLHSRLHSGHMNPSPIQAHANEQARIKATLSQRTAKGAAHRPLEDFEDLYYAILARMQDMHQILNARLGSGFNTITDTIYPDGPMIVDLYISLAQYWDVLNHTAYIKAMDSAVRRSRVKYLHQEILTQVHNDEITKPDAEELLRDLYDPNEYNGIQGLAWVSGWAPSMIAAWLEEKYRIVLSLEKEEKEKKGRMDRKRARMEKKIPQPREPRSKKEDQKRIGETRVEGREVKMAVQVDELTQRQTTNGQQNQQEQLHYELEWQMKTQRVSEYSQYLRGMASRDAKYVVQSTVFNDMRMSGSDGLVQQASKEDTEMASVEF